MFLTTLPQSYQLENVCGKRVGILLAPGKVPYFQTNKGKVIKFRVQDYVPYIEEYPESVCVSERNFNKAPNVEKSVKRKTELKKGQQALAQEVSARIFQRIRGSQGHIS